ncbi:MAG: type II toxin-antitoxin system RelE/ParE family toxin [Gemmatimonadales bacterium]|nr:type II toxin-antitoxin system RelE/ParE family toxin [Gemmatimonadales bacterium]
MSRIRWTVQASSDLDAIHEFISRDSPASARALVGRLLAAIDQLESYPQSGRVVPEFGNSAIRELVRGAYRVVYRLRGEGIELVRIHHAARPLPPDLTLSAG